MEASRIAVVGDTTAYMPAELVAAHGIHQVSLYVSLEGSNERESEIAEYGEFYERLANSDETVTTAPPSVGDFISTYEPLLAGGNEVISIHLSAGISETYKHAMEAKDRLTTDGKGGERIHVIDSQSAAGTTALMLLEASRSIASGDPIGDVLAEVENTREMAGTWFAVENLEYLRRGGRVGGARAWIGSRLKIKPILTLESEITPVERVRTRSRSIQRLADYARTAAEGGANAWSCQHIQVPDTAQQLVSECREIFGCEPAFVSEIGPVIGAHVGPGLLGISVTQSAFAADGA